MALKAVHGKGKGAEFGVGDTVRVVQKITEGDKERLQAFEGMVIRIKGRDVNKSFTVRKIGAAQVGIERIYPLSSPSIEKIEVVKRGLRGVRRAKLYYTREQSRREIDKIYSRASAREIAKKSGKKKIKTSSKSTSGKKKRSVIHPNIAGFLKYFWKNN